VTDWRLAEARLAQTQQRFRDIFSSTSLGSCS
jgi:hypothetical protein